MQLGFFDEPKRKTIKTSVKREVYKRAKGRCERCGKKLPFTGGATCYHHIRKPSISPTAKTVQLLCRNCHAEHGHKHKTVTRSGLLFEEKETVIKRKRVKKKPKIKKKTIKKTTKKKKTSKRKTTTRKKRSTKKKTKTRRKRTTKRKAKRRKR